MKASVSYFYAVRHMGPGQVPVSTAASDPAWFHGFRGQGHKFFDANGVLNGFRMPELSPAGSECEGLCRGRPCRESPDSCAFLKAYRRKIFALSRPAVEERLRRLVEGLAAAGKAPPYAEIVFLVHEAPDNPCSERAVLKEFFGCGEWDWRKARDARRAL